MNKPVTIRSRQTALWRHRLSVALFVTLTAVISLFFVFGFALDAQASGETDDATVILWIEGTNLPRNNIVAYIFRNIGWLLLSGLKFLVNGLQAVVFTVTDGMATLFTGASDSPSTWGEGALSQTWFGFLPVIILLVTLVVLYIGILFTIKPQKVGKIAMNAVIGLLVAVSLPFFVGGAFTVTSQLSHAMMDTFSESDDPLGTQIIMNGTFDVLKLDDADLLNQLAASPGNDESQSLLNQWKADPGTAPIDLHPTTIYDSEYALQHIDPTEMVGLDGMIDDGATEEDKFWGNTLTVNKDGIKELKALGDGKIGDDGTSGTIISTQYYRWNFDWVTMFVELGVLTFVLLMCGIKLVRLLFDMLVKQFLAQVLAFLDIHTMQRLKKCIYSLVASCAAFFGTFLILELYLAVHPMINSWLQGLGIGWAVVGRILIEIGLAWAVIDGPDIFEKLFGMDVGIKSAAGTLYGLQSIGHGAAAVGRGLFGTKNPSDGNKRYGGLFGRRGLAAHAVGAAGTVASGAAGIGGAIAGAVSGTRAGRQMNQAAATQGNNASSSPGGGGSSQSSGRSSSSSAGSTSGGPSGGTAGNAGSAGRSAQMAGASQTIPSNGQSSALEKEGTSTSDSVADTDQKAVNPTTLGAAAQAAKNATQTTGQRLSPSQAADVQNAMAASQNQRSGIGDAARAAANAARNAAATSSLASGAAGIAGAAAARAVTGTSGSAAASTGSGTGSGSSSASTSTGSGSALAAAAARMTGNSETSTGGPTSNGIPDEPVPPDIPADSTNPDDPNDGFVPSEPEYQGDDFAAENTDNGSDGTTSYANGSNSDHVPDTWDVWARKQLSNTRRKLGQSQFTRPVRTAQRAYDLTRNTAIKHALNKANSNHHSRNSQKPAARG